VLAKVRTSKGYDLEFRRHPRRSGYGGANCCAALTHPPWAHPRNGTAWRKPFGRHPNLNGIVDGCFEEDIL